MHRNRQIRFETTKTDPRPNIRGTRAKVTERQPQTTGVLCLDHETARMRGAHGAGRHAQWTATGRFDSKSQKPIHGRTSEAPEQK